MPGAHRVGGDITVPVPPHHRTYSAYPAVSVDVPTVGTAHGQGSCWLQRRRRLRLLVPNRSDAVLSVLAGACAPRLVESPLLLLRVHRVVADCSLHQRIQPFMTGPPRHYYGLC